ncbi:hypothetical protein KCP77_09885 [Salmonella enterica subsp. enterica]|nr:hypothetical protein KCP77_09885 [Salmonella enterica subsp. enterica]
MFAHIRQLAEEGKTMVVVTHVGFARHVSSRYFFCIGKVKRGRSGSEWWFGNPPKPAFGNS